MIFFHAQIPSVFAKVRTRERLGEEVSRIEFRTDMPNNTNRKVSDVVSDLEVPSIEMSCSLTRLRVVDSKFDRFVVAENGSRSEYEFGLGLSREIITVTRRERTPCDKSTPRGLKFWRLFHAGFAARARDSQ